MSGRVALRGTYAASTCALYGIGVGAAIWYSTAVLCAGDVKFAQGCGGGSMYTVIWSVFLAPVLITALVTAVRLRRRSRWVLSVVLLGLASGLVLAGWHRLPDRAYSLFVLNGFGVTCVLLLGLLLSRLGAELQ